MGSSKIYFMKIHNLEIVSQFSSGEEYTSGALHPDGLIYAVNNMNHHMELWDLRTQTLGSTMEVHKQENMQHSIIRFSENGYHIATSYKSQHLHIYDLRKLKCIATLNYDGVLKDIWFDYSGKFLSYSVKKEGPHTTLVICLVKDRTQIQELQVGNGF